MILLPRLTLRMVLIVGLDVFATALAFITACYLRFPDSEWTARAGILPLVAGGLCIYATFVYVALGTYRPAWRFTSFPDVVGIVRAATLLALTLLVADYIFVSPNVYGGYVIGKKTIAIYWVVQIFFLLVPRMAWRYVRHGRADRPQARADAVAALCVGSGADAEVLLRAVESGAIQRHRIVGILSPAAGDQLHSVRGVRIVGRPDELAAVVERYEARGTPIRRIIFTAAALAPESAPETLFATAQRLGIPTARLPGLDDGPWRRLAPITPEDLLLRPGVRPPQQSLERLVRGRSVLVTGGGGSIGREICRRIADLGAARLMVLDHSEPALHAATEEIAGRGFAGVLAGHIGDVRDRDRIFALFRAFRPDVVFHAAALKHVPVLEADWQEGVKTNVFGTVNVCDAAVAAGAAGMVAISTDKAVSPVSVLGITKRLAEMYCQALDRALAGAGGSPTRLINVRFGNVLGSTGSVVPKFRAQIEAGGPVTVTHPDMVRYFMTIGEAADLVITAAGHALADDSRSASVYVLNMGRPVRIVDLAERMIRLSGQEPGIDVAIVHTGVRPGERLDEKLFADDEPTTEVGLPGILAARSPFPPLDAMRGLLARIEAAIDRDDRSALAPLVVPGAWHEAPEERPRAPKLSRRETA